MHFFSFVFGISSFALHKRKVEYITGKRIFGCWRQTCNRRFRSMLWVDICYLHAVCTVLWVSHKIVAYRIKFMCMQNGIQQNRMMPLITQNRSSECEKWKATMNVAIKSTRRTSLLPRLIFNVLR